ncbi:MAG TPA: hypothetical protein VN441_04150 [Syntrophomonas sp.]|nr:hypothetical protein [Syntrophomonas sp.]
MNAIRDMYGKDKTEQAGSKPNFIVVKTENKVEAETKQHTNEYLNEMMYRFYNNGGPAMDI